MSPELINYLEDNGWVKFCDGWDLTLNSECYATIKVIEGGFVYDEDCPDVKMPIEDFFPTLFYETEEKLIQFLEKIKLTN